MGLISRVSSRTYRDHKMNDFCSNDIYNTSKAYFFNPGDIETMNETVTVRFLKTCSYDLLKVLSQRKQMTGSSKKNSQLGGKDVNKGLPKYLTTLAKSMEEMETTAENNNNNTIGEDSTLNSLSLSSLNMTSICPRDSTVQLGYTTEMPLRMAQLLRDRKIVEIDYNKAYKKQNREILQAGACTVKMNQIQNHFYELGYYLLPDNDGVEANNNKTRNNTTNNYGLDEDEDDDDELQVDEEDEAVSRILANTFQERFPIMFDKNLKTRQRELNNIEMHVAKYSLASLNRWEDHEKGRCKSMKSLTISRKRKVGS